MFEITRRKMMAGAAAATALGGSINTASAQTKLKVIVFQGLSNLAQFSASNSLGVSQFTLTAGGGVFTSTAGLSCHSLDCDHLLINLAGDRF